MSAKNMKAMNQAVMTKIEEESYPFIIHSIDELKAAADRHGLEIGATWPGTPRVEQLLAKYDKDADGLLNRQEFH